MRPLNLDKLPPEVKEALGLEEDRRSIKTADPLAQMMELRTRWRALHDVADLQPGDFCREKECFAAAMEHKVNGPLIYVYVGPIDWENHMHQAYMAKWAEHDFMPTDDCWVMMMLPGKPLMCYRPMTKASLRRLTPSEQAGLDDTETPAPNSKASLQIEPTQR
jgi:hypothetical protein